MARPGADALTAFLGLASAAADDAAADLVRAIEYRVPELLGSAAAKRRLMTKAEAARFDDDTLAALDHYVAEAAARRPVLLDRVTHPDRVLRRYAENRAAAIR